MIGQHLDAGDRLGRAHRHLDRRHTAVEQRLGDVDQAFFRRRPNHRDNAGVGHLLEVLFFGLRHGRAVYAEHAMSGKLLATDGARMDTDWDWDGVVGEGDSLSPGGGNNLVTRGQA